MLKAMVKKAKNGDEKSFCSLIEQRKESMYRIAYSYVNNSDDALDIVQEAVYKAFVSINKLKKPEYFNTWLTRITINCAIDHINKSKKLHYLDMDDVNIIQDNTSKQDANIDLNEAIKSLSVKYKTVIILKFFEDLTLQEISEILDLPLNTVKTQLYRALEKLKIELKEGELLG